ncbi:uncharacterized protein [Nicotiana tomentosiformis]|uniref:uncharacterized protein n=1 Tax=Nicotiana tomentosiformis TaxID=4098 RepID=UPI00388C78E6
MYVDDVIIKSKRSTYHIADLRKFIDRLRRYNLKLNPAKCAFGVPAGKLLGFIVSRREIELDPSKIKAIQDLPPPKNKKDKDVATSWTEECQKAFDKIKEYLSKPPVLVPPEPGRPLLLYLSVLDGAFSCVLGQHDETGRKEQAIYYLSKKFTPYEERFPYTNNMEEYEACILGLKLAIDMNVQELLNEFTDALATLSSMIQHLDKNFIDPIPIGIHNQPAYYAHVEEETDWNPWFHDIKEYLANGEPQMNGDVEAANKNIKKILSKMVENLKQWHEKLPFPLLGYRTTVRTSTGEIPYLMCYGTEAIIPVEVEIPSLRIIQEPELSDVEWIRSHYEQMALIDGKIMNIVCHGQLY